MKMVKGILIGTMISTAGILLYTETTKKGKCAKKKVMKQGKKFMKTMGMM